MNKKETKPGLGKTPKSPSKTLTKTLKFKTETETVLFEAATLAETPNIFPFQESEATEAAEPQAVIEPVMPMMGKDEMNLVEYPFALLKERGNADRSIIEISYERQHPISKRPMKVNWNVSGHPKLGLPRPSDEKLYLLLMELTRAQGFAQEVWFSRADLAEKLGWGSSKKSYDALRDAFTRLGAVFIRADNAFWNNSTKNYVSSVGFSLIDGFQINAEKPGPAKQGVLPLSSFRWNDHIFQSMQASNIRTIDVTFGLSLEAPLSLRLFRYLDKHRRGKGGIPRHKYEMTLKTLCEVHLGMAPALYPSKHKERLKTAHLELIERGFLKSASFEPMKTKAGEKVIYLFPAPRPLAEPNKGLGDPRPHSQVQNAVTGGNRAFNDILPLGLPSPQIAMQTAMSDEELLDEVCDFLFETLPIEEQDRINKQSKASLAPFLQDNFNTFGAKSTMERERRKRVKSDYSSLLKAEMQRRVEGELAAFQAQIDEARLEEAPLALDELASAEILAMETGEATSFTPDQKAITS